MVLDPSPPPLCVGVSVRGRVLRLQIRTHMITDTVAGEEPTAEMLKQLEKYLRQPVSVLFAISVCRHCHRFPKSLVFVPNIVNVWKMVEFVWGGFG